MTLLARHHKESFLSFCLALNLCATAACTAGEDSGSRLAAKVVHTIRFYSKDGSPFKGRALAFSPNSEELAVSTSAGTTAIFRVSDATQVNAVGAVASVLAFSADGKRLSVMSQDRLAVVDLLNQKAEPVETYAPAKGVIGIILEIQNGKLLVKTVLPGSPAARDGRIKVGCEVTGVDRGSSGRIVSVIGRSVETALEEIAGDAGTSVDLELVAPGESEPEIISLQRAAYRVVDDSAEFLEPGKVAVNQSLRLIPRKDHFDVYSPNEGRVLTTVWPKDLKSGIIAAASPTGQIAALVGSNGRKSVLQEHNISNRTIESTVPLPSGSWRPGSWTSAAFSADGKSLFLLCQTRVLKFDMETRTPELALNHEGQIDLKTNTEVFSVDGNLIVSEFTFQQFGGGVGWNVVRSNPDSKLNAPEIYDRIRHLCCMSVNPQGQIAMGTSEGESYLLDFKSGAHLAQIGKKSQSEVELIELSSDGKWLAVYVNGTLSLIDVTKSSSTASKNTNF